LDHRANFSFRTIDEMGRHSRRFAQRRNSRTSRPNSQLEQFHRSAVSRRHEYESKLY